MHFHSTKNVRVLLSGYLQMRTDQEPRNEISKIFVQWNKSYQNRSRRTQFRGLLYYRKNKKQNISTSLFNFESKAVHPLAVRLLNLIWVRLERALQVMWNLSQIDFELFYVKIIWNDFDFLVLWGTLVVLVTQRC